jgi:hypothetical protein
VFYEHPRGVQAHALSKPLLPSFVGNLLDVNVVTDTDDLVDESAVQALTMRGEFAFLLGKPTACCKVALTVLPGGVLFAALPDASFLVVVLGVVGSTLAVELTL